MLKLVKKFKIFSWILKSLKLKIVFCYFVLRWGMQKWGILKGDILLEFWSWRDNMELNFGVLILERQHGVGISFRFFRCPAWKCGFGIAFVVICSVQLGFPEFLFSGDQKAAVNSLFSSFSILRSVLPFPFPWWRRFSFGVFCFLFSKIKLQCCFSFLLTAGVGSFFCFLFANVLWIDIYISIYLSIYLSIYIYILSDHALDILHPYQPKSVCCFLNVFGVIFFLIKKGICICSLIYRLLQGWIFLGLFCSPPFFCVKSRLGFFPCFFIKFVGVRSALFFFYLFFPPYKANKTILLFFSVPSHQNTAFIIPRICSNLS